MTDHRDSPLRAAFQAAYDEAKRRIAPNSSDAIRAAVLFELAGLRPGTRPSDMSENLGVSTHRLASGLKLLVSARLVAITGNAENKRWRHYYLTKAGTEEVARLMADRGVDVTAADLPHLVLGQLRCRNPALAPQEGARSH